MKNIILFSFCMLLSIKAYAWSPPISGNWQLLRGYNTTSHICHSPTFNLNGSSPACDTYAIDFVPDKNFEGVRDRNSRINGIVMSIGQGKIIFAGEQEFYGRTIIIEHKNNIYSRYSHLESIYVNLGQDVLEFSFLGKSGDSGERVGKIPHLHFAMYLKISNGDIIAYKPKELGGLKNWPSKQFSLNGTAPKLRSRGKEIRCVINCSDFRLTAREKFILIFPSINYN